MREIAAQRGHRLRVAVIHADVQPQRLRTALAEGKVAPLGPVPPLSEEVINSTVSVVGQMGTEPIVTALNSGADIVLAGRSCDAAIFAAPAIRAGPDPGLAWHMGEILECGAMCAEPGSASDCMLGSIDADRFVIEPMNPDRHCTSLSVACHSLYERSSASRSGGPGHVLDLAATKFEALDGRRVAVSDSRYLRQAKLSIKLEGSRPVGFCTIVIGGIRDPIAIERLDETLQAVETTTDRFFSGQKDYALRFVVYGRDGVMGPREPTPVVTGHEIGLLLDIVGPTQERADTVCAFARSQLQHYHYKDIRASAANIAFPTAPSDISCGQIFEFSIYHLMDVDSPTELFPIEYRVLGH